MAIEVFNRKEIKYLITEAQKNDLLSIINDYMDSDPYNKDGKTYSICNLYLDSTADELIIKSLEKPVYKEKIRLRSYGKVALTDTVYLESKKKYDSVVNKRRTPVTLQEAYAYFQNGILPVRENTNLQVLKEIDYIIKYYRLQPKVFISYDRLAFFQKGDSDFRLTIDTNIQTRRTDLGLEKSIYGTQLLPDGYYLMEAKAFKAFPLWFARYLSSHKIFNTSFSKYGAEYKIYKDGSKIDPNQFFDSLD